MHSLRCSVPPQRPPVGCCSGTVVRSRGRVVTRFDARDAIEQLQAGQAQVQEQVAEIMVQLQRLQPPPPQPPAAGPAAPPPASAARAPSMEVTLALMQQDLGYIKKDISDVKQDISNLRDDVKQDISNLRDDVKQDISNLRDDVKQDVSNLRDDFKQLDNKVVGLWVAVGVLGTLMSVKVFPLLRS